MRKILGLKPDKKRVPRLELILQVFAFRDSCCLPCSFPLIFAVPRLLVRFMFQGFRKSRNKKFLNMVSGILGTRPKDVEQLEMLKDAHSHFFAFNADQRNVEDNLFM